MNQHDITIRQERKEDHRAVEELVREAFWNVYRPGCFEHYVIHVLRDDPAFVKELDLVMEQDGRLIGQNMFMETVIRADDGRDIPVLTMGPIGILPENGHILAPCDGVVAEIADTCHSLTFQTDDGMEVLLLVGIDTFTLNGDGLLPRVKEGERVTRGQPVLEADLGKIRDAGLSPMVITVLCS